MDYLKVGPYIPERGGLNNKHTNQKMYKITETFDKNKMYTNFEDITYKFWPKELEEDYES